MTLMDMAQLLGNFGEFFGAIVVVASLIYVGKQVRDSAAQIRINTTTTTASLIEDAFAPLYTTKENQDVWHIGLAKPEDLPEDEYRRFDMLMFRMFYSYQVCVVQYDDGVINDDQFNASSYYFRHLFRTPGGRRWWSETNSAFSERMRYHLEVNAGA